MKKVQLMYFCLTFIFLISCSVKAYKNDFNYIPSEGYIPDEKTAIKMAEVIWYPVYGEEIYEHLPFQAKLVDNVWRVHGTLKTAFGGVPYIEIDKRSCKIVRMYHSK